MEKVIYVRCLSICSHGQWGRSERDVFSRALAQLLVSQAQLDIQVSDDDDEEDKEPSIIRQENIDLSIIDNVIRLIMEKGIMK